MGQFSSNIFSSINIILYYSVINISLACIGCTKNEINIPNLKLGVFGGSICSSINSVDAKRIWEVDLNIEVKTEGTGGAGFSILSPNCISTQIDKAPLYDIYLLWASTNDIAYGKVGSIETKDSTTQNGGIRLAVQRIYLKNPKATIIFFTSLPFFNESSYKLIPYVEGQKLICELLDIKYLDLNQLSGFNSENYTQYYEEDKFHLLKSGYQHLVPIQVDFLRTITHK